MYRVLVPGLRLHDPCLAHDTNSSHSSPRREDDVTEQHLSVNLVEVIFWVQDHSGLSCGPKEAKMMCGFCVALGLDNQPSSSYCLPLGDASSDIPADINPSLPHQQGCS